MHARNADMELFESKKDEQLCASPDFSSEELSKGNTSVKDKSTAASEALVGADVLPALGLSTGQRNQTEAPPMRRELGGGSPPVKVRDVSEEIYKKLAEEIGRTGKIPERLKGIFKNSDPTAAQFELDKLNELLKPKGMRVDHDPKADRLDLYQGTERIDRSDLCDATETRMLGSSAREKVDAVDAPVKGEPLEKSVPNGARNPTDALPKPSEAVRPRPLPNPAGERCEVLPSAPEKVSPEPEAPVPFKLLNEKLRAESWVPDYIIPRGTVRLDKPLSDSDLIKKGRECAAQWSSGGPESGRMQISEEDLYRLKKLDRQTWQKLDEQIMPKLQRLKPEDWAK